MKPIHVLLNNPLLWLGRCLGLLVCGLLLAVPVRGQLYSGGFAGPSFKYFDLSTNTWVTTASAPTNYVYDLAYYQDKFYYFYPNYVYVYDIAAYQWTREFNSNSYHSYVVAAGNYIYGIDQSYNFKRYDPVSKTWTNLASPSKHGPLTYDGGDYIYFGEAWGQKNSLLRYRISTNTWTTLSAPPHKTEAVVFKNGKVYIGSQTASPKEFSYYNPVTQTYTSLAAPPIPIIKLTIGDGNYLYATSNNSGWARYDISTNTWTLMPGTSDINLTYAGQNCSLTASATALQATCATGGGVNANATLTLTSYGSEVTKVGYSAGSTYTGPAFASATAVAGNPMTLANNLANPAFDQPYTIRVFQDAACYKDTVVIIKPKVCYTADLSVSLSPIKQTGTGSTLQTYEVTLTNAGPDSAPSVKVRVPIPTGRTFMIAQPQQGTYNGNTQIWDVGQMAVGSKTMKITVRIN